jgi:hypothetical protein
VLAGCAEATCSGSPYIAAPAAQHKAHTAANTSKAMSRQSTTIRNMCASLRQSSNTHLHLLAREQEFPPRATTASADVYTLLQSAAAAVEALPLTRRCHAHVGHLNLCAHAPACRLLLGCQLQQPAANSRQYPASSSCRATGHSHRPG